MNVCDRMEPVGDVQNAREEVHLEDMTAVCDSLEQTTNTSPPRPSTILSHSFLPTTTITTEQHFQDHNEHEDRSEGLNQAQRPRNESAPPSPHGQATHSTLTEKHLQAQPDNGGHWEGVPQLYVTNAQTIQPSVQHLPANPEDGGYWDDPSRVYTTNIPSPSNQTSPPPNNPGVSTWHATNPDTTQALPSSTHENPPAAVWPEPNQQDKLENGIYCEGTSQVYQTKTKATQPLSPSPHNHPPTFTWPEQSLQAQPENGGYWESQSQAHTISTPTIQTLPASPLNNSAVAAWQDQNLQAKAESGRYWEGLTQVYTTSTNHPVLPPPHHYPQFPAWSEENIQVQPEAGRYWERLPQAYTANASAQPVPPPHSTLHHFHQPFPSWPEQNIQIQPQAGGYWDASFRQTGPYAIAAPGTYQGLQNQEEVMLQGHMYNVSGTYDQGQVSCNDQKYKQVWLISVGHGIYVYIATYSVGKHLMSQFLVGNECLVDETKDYLLRNAARFLLLPLLSSSVSHAVLEAALCLQPPFDVRSQKKGFG